MWCPECNSDCGPVSNYKCDCGHYKSKHTVKASEIPAPPKVASASFAAPRPTAARPPPRLVATPSGSPSPPDATPRSASSSMAAPRPRIAPRTSGIVVQPEVPGTPEATTEASAEPTSPVVPRAPPKRIVNPGALGHSASAASLSPTPPPRLPARESSSSRPSTVTLRDRDEATIKKHKELIAEMVATEESIVQSLSSLQTNYLPAFEQVRQSEAAFGAQPTDVVSLELNISALSTFHTTLLKGLREVESDDRLAVVCRQAAMIPLHLEYLEKFESALAIFERLKQNKKFKKVLDDLDVSFRPPGIIIILDEAESGMHVLDALLFPIQRLLVLSAFLPEVNKRQQHRPAPSDVLIKLMEGFSAVREKLVQCEMTKKISAIQGLLKDLPPAFTWPANRTLVRTGKLVAVMETTAKKSPTMRAQDRVVYLFSDKLLVARKEHYLYDLSIASVSIESTAGETDFIVSNSSASVCFRCEDAEERKGWVKDLETAKGAAKETRRQKQATLRPGGMTSNIITQHIAGEFEKLNQDMVNQEALRAQRVKVTVRAPGFLFESNNAEGMALSIMPDSSVEAVLEMAVAHMKHIPGFIADNVPPKFALKLEGKALDETQPVYSQTSSGTLEMTLHAFDAAGETWKPPEKSETDLLKALVALEQSCAQTLIGLRTTYLLALGQIQKEESAFSVLPTDVPALELNLGSFCDFHLELFAVLQECNSLEAVIQGFSKSAAGFSCHVDYAEKLDGVLVILDRLKQKSKFRKWMETVEKNFENKPLADCLLAPLQRVSALLEKLQSVPDPGGNLAKLFEIGAVILEKTKKIDDSKKMREVQALLRDLPKDFTWPVNRLLLKSGKIRVTLESLSRKSQSMKISERMIYLFSDKIVVTKKEPVFLYDALLASVTIEQLETETDFALTNSTLSICFRCDTSEERMEWVKEITAASEAAKNLRRAKRSLTMRNGFGRPNEELKSALEANPNLDNPEELDLKSFVALEASCAKALSLLETAYLPAVETLRKSSEYAADGPILEMNISALSALHDPLSKSMQEATSIAEAAAMITKTNFQLHLEYLDKLESAVAVIERLRQKSKSKKWIEDTERQLGESTLVEELLWPIFNFLSLVEAAIRHEPTLKDFALTLAERQTKIDDARKINEVQLVLKDLPKEFTWPAGRTVVRWGPIKSTMENFAKRKQSLRVTDRMLFLFSDKLIVAKKDGGFLFEANPPSLSIESVAEVPTDFAITNSSLSVGFRCESSEEGSSWVSDLQRTCQAAKDSRRLHARSSNKLDLKTDETSDLSGLEEDSEVSRAIKQDTPTVQAIQNKLAAAEQFQVNWRKRVDAHMSALRAFADSSRSIAESLKELCTAVAPSHPSTRVAEQFHECALPEDVTRDIAKDYSSFPALKQLEMGVAQLRERLSAFDTARANYIRAAKDKLKLDDVKKSYEKALAELAESTTLFDALLAPLLQQALKLEVLEMSVFTTQQGFLTKLDSTLR